MAIKVMTLDDMTKELPPIPTGTWTLQGLKLSVKEVTKKDKDGNEYDTDEFTLTVLPVAPGANVDPDEIAEVDLRTGKPVYEGRRVFLRFPASFPQEMRGLGNALRAMGYDGAANPYQIAEDNAVRGKTARGEIFNRYFPRKDDLPGESTGIEQKVRNWATVAKSAEFDL
jgi:hypothetical protein